MMLIFKNWWPHGALQCLIMVHSLSLGFPVDDVELTFCQLPQVYPLGFEVSKMLFSLNLGITRFMGYPGFKNQTLVSCLIAKLLQNF